MIEEFDFLLSSGKKAFKQSRTSERARNLAYGLLNCMGKHTLTGILSASGQQFVDWSSSYRLFQGDRMNIDYLFSKIRNTLLNSELEIDNPIYAHMDDTIFKKSGKKVSGTSWRRDPLGPPFHTNFIWGQRFLQISISLPKNQGASISRAIPVDLHHCPTAKKPRKTERKEKWDDYKEKKKQTNLSLKGVERITRLRENINNQGGKSRELIISVDGSYTNRNVLRRLPEKVTLIGRIRKDSKIYKLPENSEEKTPGRNRIYGDKLPTPEQIRQSDLYQWKEVVAWAAGKTHKFNVKIVKNIRWRASGKKNLQLVIIRPLAYRLTKKSKPLYRNPVYLICTNPQLEIEKLLQAYLWRWEIEVNFREEKTLLGCGQAQVRRSDSVEKLPAFIVAIYSMILLADYRSSKNIDEPQLPNAKWYKKHRRRRRTTGDILNTIRSQMYANAIGIDFSHFVNLQKHYAKGHNYIFPLFSTLFYNRN